MYNSTGSHLSSNEAIRPKPGTFDVAQKRVNIVMANSAGTDFGFLLLEPGLPESQHPGSHDHVAKYLALRNAYARTAPSVLIKMSTHN